MVGQFVDVNPAIGEHPEVAVDVANLGRGGDHALQPFGRVHGGQAGHFSSLIHQNSQWPHERGRTIATHFYTPKSRKFPSWAAFPESTGTS